MTLDEYAAARRDTLLEAAHFVRTHGVRGGALPPASIVEILADELVKLSDRRHSEKVGI